MNFVRLSLPRVNSQCREFIVHELKYKGKFIYLSRGLVTDLHQDSAENGTKKCNTKPVSLLGLGNPKSARYWRYQQKKINKFGLELDDAFDNIPIFLQLLYEKSPEEVEKSYPDAFRILEAKKDAKKYEKYIKTVEQNLESETPHFPFDTKGNQFSTNIKIEASNPEFESSLKKLEESVTTIMDAVNRKTKLVGKTAKDVDDDEIDLKSEMWRANYGTPNTNVPCSKIPCGGCGALLHCNDSSIPGYMPSERFVNRGNEQLRLEICQRCLFFHHFNVALNVSVPQEDYPNLLKAIKNHKHALIVLLVDLTDFPCSIWPGIVDLVGDEKPFFVIGNKVDLLPRDSIGYLERMKLNLEQNLKKFGVNSGENLLYTGLISAKTGYGVETLITKLYNYWRGKGDVFIVGCTNVGKSTLFNAFLQSDYCKTGAVDLVQRATTSVWPGTTISLLKFPILRASSKKLFERMWRLKHEQSERIQENQLRRSMYKHTHNSKYATLIGRIGMTFKEPEDKTEDRKPFNPDCEEFREGYYCFDTPGAVYKDQILDLLTLEELRKVLPKKLIHPRTFALHQSQTLFLAGLGRVEIETITGAYSIYITVFASELLPVHMVPKVQADVFYQENLGSSLLAVPKGGEDRLKLFPTLLPQKFSFEGMGPEHSSGDVVLSSAGWIAVTMRHRTRCTLNVFTPDARGLHERKPALLQHSVMFKGNRLKGTPAFENKYSSFLSN